MFAGNASDSCSTAVAAPVACLSTAGRRHHSALPPSLPLSLLPTFACLMQCSTSVPMLCSTRASQSRAASRTASRRRAARCRATCPARCRHALLALPRADGCGPTTAAPSPSTTLDTHHTRPHTHTSAHLPSLLFCSLAPAPCRSTALPATPTGLWAALLATPLSPPSPWCSRTATTLAPCGPTPSRCAPAAPRPVGPAAATPGRLPPRLVGLRCGWRCPASRGWRCAAAVAADRRRRCRGGGPAGGCLALLGAPAAWCEQQPVPGSPPGMAFPGSCCCPQPCCSQHTHTHTHTHMLACRLSTLWCWMARCCAPAWP